MPRIRQNEAQYLIKDFWVELDGQSGRQGLKSNAALGTAIGMSGQMIGHYRKDPGPMKLETIQKIVKLLNPNIWVVLKVLGYSDKEIRKFAKEAVQ